VLWNLEQKDKKYTENPGPFDTDKACSWSPQGTYLIVIKSDKVEFIGGKAMTPILTINEPNVESVTFSPCESYLMVYSPKSDFPYAVWNFKTHEKIREFEQAQGEDGNTFKWSFDGSYIAKITKKTVTKEVSLSPTKKGEDQQEEEIEKVEIEKTYVTVYQLPSMQMTEDYDGNKTSIFVDGLRDFTWAPHKNVLVYTSFPSGENVFPRVTF